MKTLQNVRRWRILIPLIIIVLMLIAILPQQIGGPDQDFPHGATISPIPEAIYLDWASLLPDFNGEDQRVEDVSDIPEDCERGWVEASVLAPATTTDREIKIVCNLTLEADDEVTKQLIFEGPSASGVTLDCNFAKLNGGNGEVNFKKDMIEVRSQTSFEGDERIWRRPNGVTIRDCNVIGSIRVWGMAKNGQGKEYTDGGETINYLLESSRIEGHTERVRVNAPTNIVFDNLTITGVGRNPVYFAPGVTFSALINSEVTGRSDAVGIYLDAESYANTIKNNQIHVATKNFIFSAWDRPLIAIDGSSYNKIINNRFSNLSHGGIYLYRNCGENGVIRHATPSYNQIINNIFYYNKYSGSNPAVYIGAHNYGWPQEWFSFCERDSGYEFGSSVSNRDHATHNVVMQNQIYKRSIGDMIRTKNTSVNSPNYIKYNETVTNATVIFDRKAGCYISDGYTDFILHDVVLDAYPGSNNVPMCTDFQDTCNDGDLIRSMNSSCELTRREFDCTISGDNDGCSQSVSCPAGESLVATTTACNLEWGTISDSELASVPGNVIKVIRASDVVSSGSCFFEDTSLREDEKPLDGLMGLSVVEFGCKEYDVNGGDCQARVIMYCR